MQKDNMQNAEDIEDAITAFQEEVESLEMQTYGVQSAEQEMQDQNERLSPESTEKIEFTHSPDLQGFPESPEEIDLVPNLGLSEGTPDSPKWPLPVISTGKMQTVADENKAGTSKPEGAEVEETGLEAVYQKKHRLLTPKPPQEIKLTLSAGPSGGTPEPVRPSKRSRPTRMRLLPATTKEKIQKNVADENRAGTSKQKGTKTSEMEDTEWKEAKHDKHERPTSKPPDEMTLTPSPELTEGTPEPVRPPKRSRPTRMRLLPTLSTQFRQKTVAVKKYASTSKTKEIESSEMEGSESEAAEHEILERPTPELLDEIDLTSSPELSEGTPEPIRPTRMKPNPTAGRPVRMKLLPIARGGRVKWRRDSYSGSTLGTSSRTQKHATKMFAGPSPSRARSSIRSRVELARTVPRTRVLVTPERYTPPGLPARRVLRTPERKSTTIPVDKVLRTPSKQRKRMKTGRRRQKRSISIPSDTTPSSPDTDSSSDGGGSGDSGDVGDIDDSSNSSDDGDYRDSDDSSGDGGNGDDDNKGNKNIGSSPGNVSNCGFTGTSSSEKVPKREPTRFAQFCIFL